MTLFLIGVAVGISACEVAGRHLGGYSIVLDAVDLLRMRIKQLTRERRR